MGQQDQQKDNVISLQERLAQRKQAAPPEAPPAAVSEEADAVQGALPGKLTWLFCPTCNSLEYTELYMESGRRHKCGTLVKEAVVDIDVRAEYTLVIANLERIAMLQRFLAESHQHFEEYQKRLLLMAGGQNILPYPLTQERLKTLPVVETDPFGLLITEALANPSARFPKDE